jgi:hypothetical protein
MFGPGGYPELVASDRPFSAWIFMGLAALWGEELVGCHINSVFCIGCVHYFLIIHVNLIAGDGFKGN